MKRPSPSLAVSVAALVVATGGTSFAAANMITGANVVDGTLQYKDLSSIAQRKLTGQQGPKGDPGTPGAPGTQGSQGPQGPAGVGRWILINADGTIGGQSGGFTVVAAYPTLANTAVPPAADNSLRANGNFYINANEPLDDNGIVATIALQNTVDQNGDTVTSGRAAGADANPEFSGEVTVSRCNVGAPTTPPSGPTNCAPAGAQNANSFVVSPRNSDGSFTRNAVVDDPATANVNEAAASTRKAFYVIITGDSSDFVAPAP